MPVTIRIALALACATALAACGDRPRAEAVEVTRLYPGETVEIGLRDEAALPVFLLGPGIRVEQVDPVEAGIGQPVEHLGKPDFQ